MTAHRTCQREGCDRAHWARGLCNTHYRKSHAAGEFKVLRTVEERFWAKVNKTESCWLWTGGKSQLGYGSFHVEIGNRMAAHRYSYEIHIGMIPEGLVVDHICRQPSCVNPEHLRLATIKQNCEHQLGQKTINSKSGVRGVYWNIQSKKWEAKATHNGKIHSAGLYGTIEEAEIAAIALRNKLFTHNYLDRVRPAMNAENVIIRAKDLSEAMDKDHATTSRDLRAAATSIARLQREAAALGEPETVETVGADLQ